MIKKILIVSLCCYSFLSNAQIVNSPINSTNYYNTYNPSYIVKNNVMSLSISTCWNCNDSVKTDTLKYYKKYFDRSGNEIKIINYEDKNATIYSIDSLVLLKGKTYIDIYNKKKNRPYKLRTKYLDISEEEKIITDFNEIKKYKKLGCKNIKFIDSGYNILNKYSLKGKKPKLVSAFEYDSLSNITVIKDFNQTRNEMDSVYYEYNYVRFSGKSMIVKNNIKYLHSTISLNKSLQVIQENIFDVEYNKLDVKLASVLNPSSSIIYHYNTNGLISFIEFLYTGNKRSVSTYTYEYYTK